MDIQSVNIHVYFQFKVWIYISTFEFIYTQDSEGDIGFYKDVNVHFPLYIWVSL